MGLFFFSSFILISLMQHFIREASHACPMNWSLDGHHGWEQIDGWRGNLLLSCCGHPWEMQGVLGGAVPTAQGSGGGQGCFAVI